MCLKVVENGKHKDVHIREGQVSGGVHVWLGVCVYVWLGACMHACVVACVHVWLRACVHVWISFGVTPDYELQNKI